jgi:hypothetical protein
MSHYGAAFFTLKEKGKLVPLRAMEALRVRGGIAPSLS